MKSPNTNTSLQKNYSKTTLKGKQVNKLDFQQKFNLKEDKNIFIVGIQTAFEKKLFGDELIASIEGLLQNGIQVAVRAKGTKQYQDALESLHQAFPNQVAIVEDKEEEMFIMLAAIDAQIHIPDTENESIQNSLNYGVIPVSQDRKNLEQFNAIKEEGNAFLFQELTAWTLVAACIRAEESFKFPYDWKNLQIKCMETVL